MNLLGEQVAHIFSGELDAGPHNFTWNCRGALSAAADAPMDGMYVCLVGMNGRVETLPVVLLR